MKKCASLVVLWLFFATAPAWAENFTGTWETNWGDVTMVQNGRQVTGRYGANKGKLEGTAFRGTLTFTYTDESGTGEGEFTLSEDRNSFTGRWRPTGRRRWEDWSGTRK